MSLTSMEDVTYPFLIAEVGNNHEGSIDAAIEMMEKAAEAGADAVKFQAGNADGFARTKEQEPFYRKYELGRHGYEKLLSHSVDKDIPIFFSVWSDEFKDLERRCLFSKVAARQVRDRLAYDAKQEFAPTAFVSVPHDMPLAQVSGMWSGGGIPLHCVTEYPALDPHLYRIPAIKKALGARAALGVGFSDHTVGVRAAIEAVHVYGAVAIEKHFTISHTFGPLRDHALSATPAEFKELVLACK